MAHIFKHNQWCILIWFYASNMTYKALYSSNMTYEALHSWNVTYEVLYSSNSNRSFALLFTLNVFYWDFKFSCSNNIDPPARVCSREQTSSFGTLIVNFPIILSHLREYVRYNVRYIWSFCRLALLVVDARSLGLSRKCCKKFYNTLCLLIIFENGLDTFILSSNVIIDLNNV